VVLFSTPCHFAAQSAIDGAISGLKDANGLLSKQISGGVGLHDAVATLESNMKARDSRAWLRGRFCLQKYVHGDPVFTLASLGRIADVRRLLDACCVCVNASLTRGELVTVVDFVEPALILFT